MTVTPLRTAEVPSKQEMLRMLQRLTTEVEAGEILTIVAIPIRKEREFRIMCAGKIGALELCGLLGRAWLDAQCAMDTAP